MVRWLSEPIFHPKQLFATFPRSLILLDLPLACRSDFLKRSKEILTRLPVATLCVQNGEMAERHCNGVLERVISRFVQNANLAFR